MVIIEIESNTEKKINNIITGEIIRLIIIPNLNQIKFNGVKIFEFKIPKIKKTIQIEINLNG